MEMMKLKKIFGWFLITLLVSCEGSEVTKVEENYLVKVFEYVYAPGQHAQLALISDTSKITGDPEKNSFVYLGGLGGYFSAAFARDIQDETGDDFAVWALKGASAEPAVVWVMSDLNGDGLPNETWYELKGSEFENSQRNYTITYLRTDTCVSWFDSNGASGQLIPGYGAIDSRNWWWVDQSSDTVSFTCTLLPDVMEDEDTTSTQSWVNVSKGFEWGYAENILGSDYNMSDGYNTFDISNAVDANGNPVVLNKIRFIKVQSSVFQIAGWLNEISAEIRGASEL